MHVHTTTTTCSNIAVVRNGACIPINVGFPMDFMLRPCMLSTTLYQLPFCYKQFCVIDCNVVHYIMQ